MRFVVEIQCDNDAFAENTSGEVVRILRQVANRIENGENAGGVVDSNGNSVGGYSYEK